MSSVVNATITEEYKLEQALVSVKYQRIIVTDTLNPTERYREDILTLTVGMSALNLFYTP